MANERCPAETPPRPPTFRMLASCYAHMGRLDDARTTLARLPALTSVIVPPRQRLAWRDPDAMEFFVSGLEIAAGQFGAPTDGRLSVVVAGRHVP